MLGGLVQAGTKALGGERFSVVTLMPTTLLVAFLWLLWACGFYTDDDVRWPKGFLQSVTGNAGTAILVIFGIFLLAVLLRPFQVGLVWILEGYWDRLPAVRAAAPIAVERHRRRVDTATVIRDDDRPEMPGSLALRAVADARMRQRRTAARRLRAAAVVARYPRPRVQRDERGTIRHYDDRLMPTMLGNILREGEDSAGDRYGLDLPAIAPRLYPFIQDRIGLAINRNLDAIQSGAAFAVTFALAAVAASPVLVVRDDAWRLVPVLAATIAVLAYRGTVRTARGHGRLLATAIDLYRFDMIAGMHYPLPETARREFDFNGALCRFLSGREPAWRMMGGEKYQHPDAAAGGAGPGESGTPAEQQAAGGQAAEDPGTGLAAAVDDPASPDSAATG